MELTSEQEFYCPYCGQVNIITLDGAEGRRFEMVTDCEICCRPIVVRVQKNGQEYNIEAHQENE